MSEPSAAPRSRFEDRIVKRAAGLGFLPSQDAPVMCALAPWFVRRALRRLVDVGAIHAELDWYDRTVYRAGPRADVPPQPQP